MWYNRYGLKIHPPTVSLSSFFSLLSVFFFLSYSSAPSQALNWAQLSAVTHCHSFISSLHHSFCPSADLGIHLSIHLSAPFSLTSGNDEERQRMRGEEREAIRGSRKEERERVETWGNDWKAFKTQRESTNSKRKVIKETERNNNKSHELRWWKRKL